MVNSDIRVVSTASKVVLKIGLSTVRRHLGGIDYEFVIPIMMTRTYDVENKYGKN